MQFIGQIGFTFFSWRRTVMDETTAYSQNAEDYELGNAIGILTS